MFTSPSDRSLVIKALNGKEDAWEKLINRYQRRIYNFALRMTSNREDAMDLMQEIFLSVYRNLAGFSQRAAFSAWIFKIASNRAVDFFRKKRPVDSLPMEETFEDPSPRVNPMSSLMRHESNRAVMSLLEQLSQEQRLVVELKFFQEQTFEEMSENLGVSSNTLKSRLYGALKKIKALPEVAHAL